MRGVARLLGILLLLAASSWAATATDDFAGTGALSGSWTLTRGSIARVSGTAQYVSGSPAIAYNNTISPGDAQQSEVTFAFNSDNVFDGSVCASVHLSATDLYWKNFCWDGRHAGSFNVRDANGDRSGVHTWTPPYHFIAGEKFRLRTDGAGNFFLDTNGVLADSWTDGAEVYHSGNVGISAVGTGTVQGIEDWVGGDVSSAPVITADPSNVAVTAPTTANFSVTATGSSLTYQWQIGTTNVSTGSGGTTNSYTTSATSGSDDGSTFRCIVSNGSGADTSAYATLTVHLIPTVTVDPSNASKTVGQTATFSTTATGTTPFTYQWQKGRVNLCSGGTSSTLTRANVQITDNGNLFRCIISNAYGADTTAEALLSVSLYSNVIQAVRSSVNSYIGIGL